MASLSPQRSRRAPTHQISQGVMLNHPAREASQSPPLRERPRAIKGQSMPMLPTNAIFSVQQGSQQSSPTIPNNNGRRTPPLGQITRRLPTPPHPNPPNFVDDRRMSPPPGLQQSLGQSNVSSQYSRPPIRVTGGSYPTKLHQLEEYQMTPELLADIERADQQYQSVQPNQPYPYGPGPRGDSPSSAKGPIRGQPDRTSPNNPDNGQQRGGWQNQQQQVSRDSPKARDRQPTAANGPPFTQNQGQSHTPERRLSPVQHTPLIPGEPHPASYLAHFANREAAARRAPNNDIRLNASMASQTPPLQNIPTRTPDRSLPVQEEDEVTAKNNAGPWQVDDQPTEEEEDFHSLSPTPSSDLNPEENNHRFDNNPASHSTQAVHRDDDQAPHAHDNSHAQYVQRDKRDSNDEDGSHTPRSPTSGLPENDHAPYYSNQNMPGINPALPAPRAKARNGSTDHVMLGLESAIQNSSPIDVPPQQQQQQQQQQQPTERPSQYADQRQHNGNQHNGNNGNQYPTYPTREEYAYIHEQQRQQNPNDNGDGRYNPSQAYRDGFQSYGEDSTSAYIRSYLHSPRPDAPIPPTPHSQTAAPSPSPLLSGYNGKDLPSYPPIPTYPSMRAAGSPYPFPYGHVRRNRQPQDPYLMHGLDHNSLTLTEQLARQYRIYAQNNQGNITDSTLSPSSTPFPNELFQQWANVHVKKKVAANPALDSASIRSSPSHQPISLDFPPAFQTTRNKPRGYQPKRRSYDRKPPPRVESTQPRETSPENSSSGEETSTAGEERPRSAPVERVTVPLSLKNGPASVLADAESEYGDWIDDDEDDDYEDLIDLEYHPTFVRNISKRRRKWEVGWENLIQAFQALDRQTDATMILVASPSHTTKLHSLRSRSIRRQPHIANSMGMAQIRSGFCHIASQRRAIRPEKSSLVDRLMVSSTSSGGDASDGSSGSVEENLRRALDAALGSLGAMGEVYEQREMRVMEELQRSREDRERVELLLRQVLGDRNPVKTLDQRSAV